MSSHASSPSSPISISSTLTEERSTRTMADVIKNYKTEELIDYLRRQDLDLKESHFKIFRQEEISGRDFLKLSKQDLKDCGFKVGPATRFVDFIDEISEQKIRSFSSYKTLDELKDVLRKYKVNGEDINDIKQFIPDPVKIDDNDEAFKHCVADIILILTNIETMTDANEATRCEFISSILHASLAIVRRITKEEKLYIFLQKDVSGEEASGRVDYAIKGKEDLMCIAEGKPRNIKIGYLQNIMQLESAYHTNKKKRTAEQAFGNDEYDYLYGIVSTGMDWHFLVFTTDGLYCTSESEYQINLSKTALKEDIESIRKGVKRVLGVIVGLLKDRVTVDNSPASKRARIKKITKK